MKAESSEVSTAPATAQEMEMLDRQEFIDMNHGTFSRNLSTSSCSSSYHVSL